MPASQIVAGKYLIIGRPPPRVEIRRRLWFTSRLEALHAAKLFLADEELYAVWDAIADSEEAAEDDRVPRLHLVVGQDGVGSGVRAAASAQEVAVTMQNSPESDCQW